MSTKKLSKEALMSFVDGLLAGEKVVGVQAKGDKFDFAPLASSGDLRLDYDVTLMPPRKYFLPPVETLLTCDAEGTYKSHYGDYRCQSGKGYLCQRRY